MANNRFYLRCKCLQDDGVMIGKDMLSGWYYGGIGDKVKEISDYLGKHDNCYFKLNDPLHYFIDYEDYDPFNKEENMSKIQFNRKEIKKKVEKEIKNAKWTTDEEYEEAVRKRGNILVPVKGKGRN